MKIEFKNYTKGATVQTGGRFDWDFGDGQKATGNAPSHVYLAAGDYVVTLKASRLAQAGAFRTTVHVDRDWWKQTQPKLDDLKTYADMVAEYDLKAVPTPALRLVVSMMDHEKRPAPMMAAASELVLNRDDFSDDAREAMVLLLGQKLRDAREFDRAIAAYRQVEGRVKLANQKAEAAVQVGETLLRGAHRFDEAEKEYTRVLKTYANAGAEPVLRRCHVGLADIARHAGDGKKALKEYHAAAAMRVSMASPNEMAVRIGTLARYIEEYTRQKDWEFAFKFLDDWGWEFPEEKVEGHWSLLRAKALIARGDREEALLEALDLTASFPHSAYAVQLLILAAECQVALGRRDQAKALLQTAAEDYPEDPYQNEAKDKLKNIDTWKVETPKPEPPKPEPKPAPKAATKPATGK
jgi:TolA-binding protein